MFSNYSGENGQRAEKWRSVLWESQKNTAVNYNSFIVPLIPAEWKGSKRS